MENILIIALIVFLVITYIVLKNAKLGEVPED